MKFLIVALSTLALICQITADCDQEERRMEFKKFHLHMKECAEEYGISRREMRNISDDKKCFYQCVLMKENLMDEEGEIDMDKFKESHKCMPEEMIETHRKCADENVDPDPCTKAQGISQCIRKEMDKHHEEMRKILKECMKEYDIPEDFFRRHRKIPDDKKCFFKCTAVKSGIMKENGEFTVEEFTKKHKHMPKMMLKNIEECANENSSEEEDACDIAEDFSDCLRKKMPHPHHHHGKPF